MAIDIKKLISDFDYLLKKETENKFFIRKSLAEKAKENLYIAKSAKDQTLARALIAMFNDKEIKKKLELEESFEYWEWVATPYYYSMLKIAKTIIAKKGYETDDHYATLCALAKLFVVKNELDLNVLELFKHEKFHHSLNGGLLRKPQVNLWNFCVLKNGLAVSEANMPPVFDRWSASPIFDRSNRII